MKRSLYTLLVLIVSCSTGVFAETASTPSAKGAAVALKDTTATYSGVLSERNVERFLDIVRGKKVSELVIFSGGGEVNAGMKMGNWVFDNKIDIVVEGMCMSSCANYIFTAGRHKTIKPGAVVAWHGSLMQDFGMSDEDVRAAVIQGYNRLPENEKTKNDIEDLVNRSILQMREYRKNGIARQNQFFRKIGVDGNICMIGLEKYGAKDFFVLSVQDMARFGVLDVHAPENYEKTDLTPFRRKGHSVEFISLRAAAGGPGLLN